MNFQYIWWLRPLYSNINIFPAFSVVCNLITANKYHIWPVYVGRVFSFLTRNYEIKLSINLALSLILSDVKRDKLSGVWAVGFYSLLCMLSLLRTRLVSNVTSIFIKLDTFDLLVLFSAGNVLDP